MLLRGVVVLMLLVSSLPSRADTLGLYVGVGYWTYEMDGTVLGTVDLFQDMGVKDDNGIVAYAALEHPVPLLPNVRFAFAEIGDEGAATVTQDFEFNGIPFTTGQQVETVFDVSHYDLTLYYEIIDTGMDLDLGVTGKWFQGDVAFDIVREDVVAFLPTVYANFKLPFADSGVYVGATANASGDILDYQLKVGWETENFIFPEFGIEAAYRGLEIDADEDTIDLLMDVDITGFQVSLTAHF